MGNVSLLTLKGTTMINNNFNTESSTKSVIYISNCDSVEHIDKNMIAITGNLEKVNSSEVIMRNKYNESELTLILDKVNSVVGNLSKVDRNELYNMFVELENGNIPTQSSISSSVCKAEAKNESEVLSKSERADIIRIVKNVVSQYALKNIVDWYKRDSCLATLNIKVRRQLTKECCIYFPYYLAEQIKEEVLTYVGGNIKIAMEV